jgi:hypothetical protein
MRRPDVGVADPQTRVEAAQLRPQGDDPGRRHEPDGHEREPDSPEVYDKRREQGAGGYPDRQHRLERRERAREYSLIGQPGQHREGRDVDERVTDPHDREERDRGRDLRTAAMEASNRAVTVRCVSAVGGR